MYRKFLFVIMILASTLPCGIYAESFSIAAVVGNKVITRLELQNLVKAIAALDSSAAENEPMLKQQVLGVLVKTNMQIIRCNNYHQQVNFLQY